MEIASLAYPPGQAGRKKTGPRNDISKWLWDSRACGHRSVWEMPSKDWKRGGGGGSRRGI